MRTPLYYLLIPFFLQAQAILVNVTVDDSGINPLTGQPITYSSPGVWNLGANCTACTAQIDARNMQNGTWHDSTFNPMLPMSPQTESQLPTASLVFNGTAVYVTCAIARTTSSPNGFSDMSFFIDGNLVGTFVKTPPGLPGYDFNFTVYSNTSLPPGRHELTIRNGHINGNKSLILLDSITYSHDDGKGSSNRIPLIVGLTMGGFVFLALITAFVVFVSRRSRQMNTLQFSDGRTRPFVAVYANPQGAASSSQITSLSTLGFSANPSFAAFNGHGASLGSSASQTTASRERPPALSIFIPSSTSNSTPMISAAPPAYYIANDPDSIRGGDVGDKKYARAA